MEKGEQMSRSMMKEPQYECVLEAREKFGAVNFGLMSGFTWLTDPKRLLFLLSRYKFVAKCFSGFKNVLEVGCADAFGTRVTRQEVGSLTAIDFDPVFIEDARKCQHPPFEFDLHVHDILAGPFKKGHFDGIYSLDVLEHIPPEKEHTFLLNMADSLHKNGTLIIGTPSLASQAYASPASKEGHVNCKDHTQLKTALGKFFHNVFLFSMNDEVVHTGFYPMANYLLAVCTSPDPLSLA